MTHGRRWLNYLLFKPLTYKIRRNKRFKILKISFVKQETKNDIKIRVSLKKNRLIPIIAVKACKKKTYLIFFFN